MKKLLVALLFMFAVSTVKAEVKLIDQAILPDLNLYTAGFYSVQSKVPGIGCLSDLLRWRALDISVGYVGINDSQYYVGSVKLALDRLSSFGIKNVQFMWDGLLKTSTGIWVGYSFDQNLTPSSRWTYGVLMTIMKIGN